MLFQSFFLHRYGAHRQFTMRKGWENAFYLVTWFVAGPSYLSPRAYAIMHRMHHAYSDTSADPHSPVQQKNFFVMMWRTKKQYEDIKYRRVSVDPRFEGGYPEWPLLDDRLSNWWCSLGWAGAYTLVYLTYATHWWMFLLLPFHCLLGPVHGAIVNFCGHKLGYRNFDSEDNSKNTLVFDFLTMGELFQNNHHKWCQSPNFAVRSFEINPAYQVIRVLGWLRIIDLSGAQRPEWRRAGTGIASDRALPPAVAMPSPLEGE